MRAPDWLLLDYDGTLCELASRPEQAVLPESRRALLQRLSRRADLRVALITGRSLESLRSVAGPLSGCDLATCGGFRWLRSTGESWRLSEAEALRPQLDRLIDRLRPLLRQQQGLRLEDKALTAALHWRGAAEAAGAAREAVAQAMARLPGLRALEGDCVLELQPDLPWDKGSAVRALLEGQPRGRLWFFGDDAIDEPAFAAVQSLGGTGVRVGRPRGRTAARQALEDPAALQRWLQNLAAR